MSSQMKLSDGEKLILIMLSEIHEKLGIKNGVDTELVKEAIYSGNLWGMKWAFTGIFHGHEASEDVLNETVNILDMWSFLERDYGHLSAADKLRFEKETEREDVKFSGFDGNGESEYISVADFLIDRLDRFQIFKGRDLNAHMPTIDAHRRMLAVFEPIREKLGYGPMTVDAIIEIISARIHPDHRKKKADRVPSGGGIVN